MDENVKHKGAEPKTEKDDNLNQGLEETFPGSDPVSVSQPGQDDEMARTER